MRIPKMLHCDLIMKNITVNSKVYNLENAECIGQGNFAKVYKTYSKEHKGYIAVRTVEKSTEDMEDLLKEKSINRDLMKVESPYILKIYEIQETDKLMLYVTQFCEGGSLWECLTDLPGNRFDEFQTVQLGIRVAKGIQVLHNNKITHRDLKPENILLQRKFTKGQVPDIKIADFGLSTKKMIMETLAGTKEYIAPEQAKYQSYTNAVDVWALGIILDEMLHGSTFYSGDTNKEVFKKIATDQYYIRNTKISQELQDLLLAMLKKKPFERPTIGQIISKLQNITRKDRNRTPNKNRPVSVDSEKPVKLMKNSEQPEFKNIQFPNEQTVLCKTHRQPAVFIGENDEYLCDICFQEQTIPIQQYLKTIQPPQSRVFKSKYIDFNFKWHLDLDDSEQTATFQQLKKRFNVVNLSLKKEAQIKQLTANSQKIVNSQKQLAQTFQKLQCAWKQALFSQIDEQLDQYLSDL